MSEYGGNYNIGKSGVYSIWANRNVGGQWGDGMWTIRILASVGADDNYIHVSEGFSIEECNSVVDKMEALMVKYNISDCKKHEQKKEQPWNFMRAMKNRFKFTVKKQRGEIMNNTELWKQAENEEIKQWSIFKDQYGNEIIWTGRSFQAYTDEIELDKYVGMCIGDAWEFVGVEEEDNGSREDNE